MRRQLLSLALFMAVCMREGGLGDEDARRRAAGGRGPELRSRVTQALDAHEAAVRQDPTNGRLWWDLGVEAQVAAGGSVVEEVYAAEMLERGMSLEPSLAQSYDNVMKVGDVLRGVRNTTRARSYYTLASSISPLASVPYVYSGLTLEMEGDFGAAARSYQLACRIQALGAQGACEMLREQGLDRYAAGCQASNKGASTYLAYLAAMQLKGGDLGAAQVTLSFLQGLPSRRALRSHAHPYLVADPYSGRVYSLLEDPAWAGRRGGLGPSTGEIAGGWGAAVRAVGSAQPSPEAARAVQNDIHRLQFPPGGCARARLLLYDFSQAFGFGAHAHMLSLALNIAHYTGRTLVPLPSSSWWLVDASTCGRGGFSCFFHDVTSCAVSAEEASKAPSIAKLGAAGLSTAGGPRLVSFEWESQTLSIRTGILRHYVPPVARPFGAAWWRGQATAFLMRPRDWLEEELAQSQRRMGWLEPAVGLHVRHGDKLKEANRIAVDDYLRVVLPLASEVGARSIFVSTDSPDVLHELEARAPEGLSLVAERDEIRGTDITNANLMNNLRLNVTRYTLEAVRGVLLLSRTQALVATFSSNFGRLAYELMLARDAQPGAREGGQGHPVSVSLDLPWFAFP